MRLLLFLISLLFSVIFYIFYLFSKGKDIFGNDIISKKFLETLSGNLLIETFVFLFIGIFFLIFFSPIKNSEKTFVEDKFNIFYLFFYTIFLFSFLSPFFEKDFFIISTIGFFLFGDICFSIISNFKIFKEQKLNLRYFGISLNYLAILISLYYIYNISSSFLLILILSYSAFFNYFIHKKYTNYISLFLSIGILIFLLYFFLLQVYYYFINII